MGNAAAIAAAFGGGLPPGISGTNDRCTILVSNLNTEVIISSGFAAFAYIIQLLCSPDDISFVIPENRRGQTF